MTLEAALVIFGDGFYLGLQFFMTALGVGKIIRHFQRIIHFQVVEHIRALFDQYAHSTGGDIPQFELIEGRQAFCGELDAVVSLCCLSSFRSSFRCVTVRLICAHVAPPLNVAHGSMGPILPDGYEITYNQIDIK